MTQRNIFANLVALDSIAGNDDNGRMKSYPGGKSGAGVYQKLISLIPPHATYIETHLGGGAVMNHKRPATTNIGIDIDPALIKAWQREPLELPITLVCEDAVSFLKRYSFDGTEFVYADPPYLKSTRRGGTLYRYEYTTAQHIELLSCLKNLPCRVMISGYWSKLYATTLSQWHTVSFQAQTRSGTPATEWVWLNYPQPIELHDYRYLGNTFRERERIKRKKARWINRLKKMPRLERQALLASLHDTSFGRHHQK